MTKTVNAYCPKCKQAELHIQMDNGKFICKQCFLIGRADFKVERNS